MLTADDVVRRAGGVRKVARMFDISTAAVYQWIDSGYIPHARAIKIARDYSGIIKLADIPTRDA